MVEALVIPFVVVVRDELAAGATPRALADQDQALEAGVLDGAPEARRGGVQVILSLMVRPKRAVEAFRFGARAGRRMGVTSAGGSGSRTAGRKSGSRSWMRTRMCRRHPSSAAGASRPRVAVMDEDPDVSQASVLGSGGVPHELGAPRPVGLGADARDRNAAAGQVHQDQHGDAGQAAWRPELDREAVGGGEHVPVGRETLPPGRARLAVGGGF